MPIMRVARLELLPVKGYHPGDLDGETYSYLLTE